MKQRKKALFLATVLLFLMTASSIALANSSAIRIEGNPSAEVFSLDEDCPVEIKKEILTFDLRREEGRISALYEMVNIKEEDRTVAMAFPFWGRPSYMDQEQIRICADGKEVPYSVYLAGSWQDTGEALDMEALISQLNLQRGLAEEGDFTKKGVYYRITWNYQEKEGEEPPKLEVSFFSNPGRYLIDSFSGYSYDEERENSCLFETLRQSGGGGIFCLDSGVEPIVSVTRDGKDRKEEAGIQVEKWEMTTLEYVRYYLAHLPGGFQDSFWPEAEEKSAFRTYMAEYIKEQMESGVVSMDDIWYGMESQVMVFVYEVEFPANGTVTAEVSYGADATMDRSHSEHYLQSYRYFLTPASRFRSFSDLEIRVLPDEGNPYLVEGSLDFTRQEDGAYIARLSGLPKEELSFSMYPEAEVKEPDKLAEGVRTVGFLFRALGGGILLIAAVMAAVWFFWRARRNGSGL